MTSEEFRSIALELPGAVESAHMRHPDFRMKGKVFATLDYPKEGWGMVKLTPDQQRYFVTKAPKVFNAANGAWGRAGSTVVRLTGARTAIVRSALLVAFQNLAAAPKRVQPAPK